MKKAAALIAKKQENRLTRKARKKDKLVYLEKGCIRPYFRTRAHYGLAGIPRRIQRRKARNMMQLIYAREAAEARLYADPWSWRI